VLELTVDAPPSSTHVPPVTTVVVPETITGSRAVVTAWPSESVALTINAGVVDVPLTTVMEAVTLAAFPISVVVTRVVEATPVVLPALPIV